MIGQVNDLVESIQHVNDGAPRIPNGTVGFITQVGGGGLYKIRWMDYDDYKFSRDARRLRIITHGRKSNV